MQKEKLTHEQPHGSIFLRYWTRQLFWCFDLKFEQVFMYLSGVTVFSLGAKFFIVSQLGTDPLDVLIISFDKHLGLGMGACSAIISALFLTWWMLWNKQYPPLSPFITTTLTGLLVDLWTALGMGDFLVRKMNVCAMLGTGLLLCAYASALIIMSGIGIRIMDLVVLTMVSKWNWPFTKAKMLIEIGIFSLGWLLGGPFGLGTLAFLLVIGPLIQPFMSMNVKRLSLRNYGMQKPSAAY